MSRSSWRRPGSRRTVWSRTFPATGSIDRRSRIGSFPGSCRRSRRKCTGYFDANDDGQAIPGAAWFYDDPKPGANEIAGRVAFWRVAQIEA
ncbi:MAG: DUF427 domain-containing protein [Acidimicrobiia bacterium]